MFRKSLSLLLLLSAPVLFGACSDDEPTPEPAALIIDRGVFDFGEVEAGKSSSEQLFTVRNASPSAVKWVSVSLEGSDYFTLSSSTCERYLDAGMECEVRVKFTPRLGGLYSARLKVEGAPSVDQTEIKGTSVAWVEVTSLPPGTRVVAGDDSFTCDKPCRQAVRRGELTLYAAPEGFPTWSGDCAAAPRGGCLLRLDGPKSVALQALSPVYQWEVRRSRQPVTVATVPGGDILVQDALGLTRLSSSGQERWTLPVLATAALAVDSNGNTYLLNYTGTVTRYDADGRTLWTYTPQGELPGGRYLVAGADGDVYVLLTLGRYDSTLLMKLVRLSPEGTERWSAVIDEAQLNYPSGLGVDAAGQAYVGGTAFNRGASPPELVFVKNVFRKFTTAGAPLWTTDSVYAAFAVSPSGQVSSIGSFGMPPPGGYSHWWIGADGAVLWNVQTPSGKGPGLVDTQGFAADGTLLVGGHESRPDTDAYGRGWFAAVNLTTRAPGPVTYIAPKSDSGARVGSLALTASGNVVVGGGFGSVPETSEGFVRLYDARALTTER